MSDRLLPQFSSFFTIVPNIDTALSSFCWRVLAACKSKGEERWLYIKNAPSAKAHLLKNKNSFNLILPEGQVTDSLQLCCHHHPHRLSSSLECSGVCERKRVPQTHPTISKWTNTSYIYNNVPPYKVTETNWWHSTTEKVNLISLFLLPLNLSLRGP